ncbi:unnamed protein product [Phytophthora lilii]|uniref:Unnamed protein product n=1 Tax=Phytophthora lilii TaxID=2077276 RepID=A0A9W6TUR5_9STRA|nr:unnamed protein product [Phytophthora lilii]
MSSTALTKVQLLTHHAGEATWRRAVPQQLHVAWVMLPLSASHGRSGNHDNGSCDDGRQVSRCRETCTSKLGRTGLQSGPYHRQLEQSAARAVGVFRHGRVQGGVEDHVVGLVADEGEDQVPSMDEYVVFVKRHQLALGAMGYVAVPFVGVQAGVIVEGNNNAPWNGPHVHEISSRLHRRKLAPRRQVAQVRGGFDPTPLTWLRIDDEGLAEFRQDAGHVS